MYRKAEWRWYNRNLHIYILPSHEEIRCRCKVWWFVCKHNPRFLLKTSNRILNPAQYAFPAMCSDDFYFSLLERSVVCDLNRSIQDPINLPKCIIQCYYLSLISFPGHISLIKFLRCTHLPAQLTLYPS